MQFLGNVENVELYFKNADILKTSTHEGLPLTVLEAMASGLPIISTNVGGLRMLLPTMDYWLMMGIKRS